MPWTVVSKEENKEKYGVTLYRRFSHIVLLGEHTNNIQ